MTSAVIMTLARQAAIKAVELQIHAKGLRPIYVERQIIFSAAQAYLRDHPELIEQAEETVRNHPKLRTLAERQDRQRRKINDE